MQESIQGTEADRLALRKMFQAIAEYGRKVRLSRQETVGTPISPGLETPEGESKRSTRPPRNHRREKEDA